MDVDEVRLAARGRVDLHYRHGAFARQVDALDIAVQGRGVGREARDVVHHAGHARDVVDEDWDPRRRVRFGVVARRRDFVEP